MYAIETTRIIINKGQLKSIKNQLTGFYMMHKFSERNKKTDYKIKSIIKLKILQAETQNVECKHACP